MAQPRFCRPIAVAAGLSRRCSAAPRCTPYPLPLSFVPLEAPAASASAFQADARPAHPQGSAVRQDQASASGQPFPGGLATSLRLQRVLLSASALVGASRSHLPTHSQLSNLPSILSASALSSRSSHLAVLPLCLPLVFSCLAAPGSAVAPPAPALAPPALSACSATHVRRPVVMHAAYRQPNLPGLRRLGSACPHPLCIPAFSSPFLVLPCQHRTCFRFLCLPVKPPPITLPPHPPTYHCIRYQESQPPPLPYPPSTRLAPAQPPDPSAKQHCRPCFCTAPLRLLFIRAQRGPNARGGEPFPSTEPPTRCQLWAPGLACLCKENPPNPSSLIHPLLPRSLAP